MVSPSCCAVWGSVPSTKNGSRCGNDMIGLRCVCAGLNGWSHSIKGPKLGKRIFLLRQAFYLRYGGMLTKLSAKRGLAGSAFQRFISDVVVQVG